MDGEILPYIMYVAVIFLAIAITIFACIRWRLVKKNGIPTNATLEGTRYVLTDEHKALLVDLTYVFDDILYRGSTDADSADPDDYIAGANVVVLVNPKEPTRFNKDRNYSFQKTRIAKWLECRLTKRGGI